MENKSNEISWLDRDIKRFKETGTIIPAGQRRIYEKIAEEWVSGRTVIDIGCSIGVGSNILSHYARFVWGIDVNKEAVEFANLYIGRPNLNFAVLDIEHPPTREISNFEVIVAVEILEHLKDVQAGLNTIKKFFSIRRKSMCFITAPNLNNEEVKKRDDKNGLHLQHWTAGDFYKLMIDNFQSVVFYSGDKLNRWTSDELTDGNSKASLVVAKVEGIK